MSSTPTFLSDEPTNAIARRLNAVDLRRAVDIRDWTLREGRTGDADALIAGLAERLNAADTPVDRLTTMIEALHSEYAGVSREWRKDVGLTVRRWPHFPDVNPVYQRSPFALAHERRSWIVLDLPATPDDAFGIVPDLKALGLTHYVCVPIFFADGDENGLTFATARPGGFTPRDLDMLRFVMPTVGAVLETRALASRLDEVLRLYVGADPHDAILKGNVVRGQVTTIRSCILFADLRDYTRITSTMDHAGIVGLLNALFDCLVPSIEAAGGEVLKYLGDGLLAIFRDPPEGPPRADAALAAARAAFAAVEAANADGTAPAPLAIGVALHHGEAAYGNVGSGARLDFTVVGRDVNLASRIADMNRTLGEPLLVSEAFAGFLTQACVPLGRFNLKGFEQPTTLLRPEPAKA